MRSALNQNEPWASPPMGLVWNQRVLRGCERQRVVRGLGRLLFLLFALALAFATLTPARAADVASRTLLLDATLAGDAVVAVGERGTVLRASPLAPAGTAQAWTATDTRVAATLTAVSFADAQRGWAVGHDALILTTSDGGASWTRQWQGESLADSFLDVLAIDSEHVIAVGAYGLFVETVDAGKTWTRRKVLDEDYHLNRLSRGPTGTLYLAGEHGTLLRSADQGATWTAIPTPYEGSFYGILPLDAQTLLAHGLRGRVYRSTDDGRTWNAIPLADQVLLSSAIALHNGTVVLAGQARAVLVSTDRGATFTRRDVGVTTGISELLELPGGLILAVGEAGASRIDLNTSDRSVRK